MVGLLALCALVVVALLFPRSRRPVSPATGAWRIVVPRQARFSVGQAAAWFASLQPLLKERGSALSVEQRNSGQELHLFLFAPLSWEEALRGQLAAWFPGARLERELPIVSRQVRVAQSLRPEQPEILPIRSASDSSVDPLLGVVGALTQSSIPCGVRLTCRAQPANWTTWARQAMRALEAGEEVAPRSRPGWLHFLSEFGQHLISPHRRAKPNLAPPPAVLASAQDKARAEVYDGGLVVWAEAPSLEEARAEALRLGEQLTAAYRDPLANGLKAVGRPQVYASNRNALDLPAGRAVYSVSELASLFHLPNADHTLVPTEAARQVAPPPDLTREAQLDAVGSVQLGEALTREGPRPFGLRIAERRLHLYVVGKTGTGKSTFLANLANQDLQGGRGLALIDPHGDLAERVLSLVPPERADHLLYFNAADTDFPVGFNLLSATSSAQRPLVASGVVGVFKKLYGESWGPRLEHFLRNAVLALLESPSPSLLLLPRLLTDRPFRHRLLTYVCDPLLRSFFLEEYEQYDVRWRAEAISPILNKVGQFLASPVVRHIVGQHGSGFDLRQVMDSEGVFIANLASGRIGEDNSDLLGGLLVAGFQLAAMSRADQPEEERRDFQLLVDEFQHFANDSFTSILSEARKYRLSLTLSHQYLDQLPTEISDAVFGNAGSLCVFRVGAGDTTRLVRELAPNFDAQDLIHLPNYRFCARINRGGETVLPFSARSFPPLEGIGSVQPLIERSRRRWARTRAEVELEIADLWEGRVDP